MRLWPPLALTFSPSVSLLSLCVSCQLLLLDTYKHLQEHPLQYTHTHKSISFPLHTYTHRYPFSLSLAHAHTHAHLHTHTHTPITPQSLPNHSLTHVDSCHCGKYQEGNKGAMLQEGMCVFFFIFIFFFSSLPLFLFSFQAVHAGMQAETSGRGCQHAVPCWAEQAHCGGRLACLSVKTDK